jgi:hypothetical protein
MHPDLAGRVDDIQWYGSLTDGSDEHSHGTHVAGIVAGNGATGEADENGALYGLGVAPGAHIVSQRIFDGLGIFQSPPTFETLTRDAVNAGADIGSNSWGEDNQGRYDTSALEFDALVRDADASTPGDQPYILEFSAGNSGPGARTVGTPAVAKNVITTGASQNNRSEFLLYPDGQEAMADFSSRGPCEDGRIKPDLVAPGTWIASLRSVFADDANAWGDISSRYMYQGGTSQAGPQVSGAAAVFVEYYRTVFGTTPSPALVKAGLINSSVDMDDAFGTQAIPNNAEGWGRVDLTQLIGATRLTWLIDQTNLLATGQSYSTTVVIEDSSEPFKVTLAYTDVPGFPGAVPALVNDLDLEVVSPNGTLYRGNQMAGGDAIANAPSPDEINNVEAVHLLAPQPGEYLVRVRATDVAQDARADTGAVDQDFGLAISGLFLPAGKSLVYMDQAAYSVPGQVIVGVIDRDQAGQGSVTATLSSDTEAGGEPLTLLAAGSGGIFTNTIPLTTGPASPDGQLQVAHADIITASYTDVSAGQVRTSTADADLLGPVISGVASGNQFGKSTIFWDTDEAATSRVDYGTNTALGLTQSSVIRTTEHELPLPNLLPGVTYYYQVISTDLAGNRSTNDNGGSLFTLVAPTVPPVLFVDGFYDDFLFPPPPAGNYTNTLNTLGVAFDYWDHQLTGSPTLSDLQPYRVVIWRLPEFNISSYPRLTPDEQIAIEAYLDAGGSFLLASMDVTTRLAEGGADEFRAEVLGVSDYTEDVTVPSITGVDNDVVSDGISVTLDFLDYVGFDISDTIVPTSEAVGIFVENSSGDFAGLRYPAPGVDADGRLVFLSFPLDAIPTSGSEPNNRAGVLRRILQYLSPGVTGEAVVSTDRPTYTLPSAITVEVGDVDLGGAGTVSVTLFSTTEPGGKPMQLAETSKPGIFTGQVQLIHGTNSGSTNQLRAVPGDTLTFRFFDPSIPGNVDATATVDVTAPVISAVAGTPGFSTATISWTTDEKSDSLVQFGESLPLPINRTEYDPALTTSHQVTLTALDTTKQHFYQVVSRDAAGNTTVDDNGGNYYTFTTLTPVNPPLTNAFESGVGLWSVSSEDYSESEWTLGVPNNGRMPTARSPVNAWGSLQNGGSPGTIDTFLTSPAINLVGGNQATLHFWHSREFVIPSAFDILAGGEVTLVRDGTGEEIQLAIWQDNQTSWTAATIDLTPYIGEVIYLVWHHQLFSFDYVPRGGWMIDDVGITMASVNAGTVTVSNNLSQATFTLSGATTVNGAGTWLAFSNAPVGTYSVTFDPVPYHLTPGSQTNSLTTGSTLAFTASYTFPDTNTNGISDDWEQEYFGGVSPGHSGDADTDGDGLNDAGEFAAGTNPTNANSTVRVSLTLQPNDFVRLQWPTSPGHRYLLENSTDGINWTTAADWTRAGGDSMAKLLNRPVVPTLYRVHVRP